MEWLVEKYYRLYNWVYYKRDIENIYYYRGIGKDSSVFIAPTLLVIVCRARLRGSSWSSFRRHYWFSIHRVHSDLDISFISHIVTATAVVHSLCAISVIAHDFMVNDSAASLIGTIDIAVISCCFIRTSIFGSPPSQLHSYLI